MGDMDMADIEDTMERGPLMLSLQLNPQRMLLLMLLLMLMLGTLPMVMDTADTDMADMEDTDTTASNSRWGNNNSRSLSDDSPVTFTSFNRVFFWSIFSVS